MQKNKNKTINISLSIYIYIYIYFLVYVFFTKTFNEDIYEHLYNQPLRTPLQTLELWQRQRGAAAAHGAPERRRLSVPRPAAILKRVVEAVHKGVRKMCVNQRDKSFTISDYFVNIYLCINIHIYEYKYK